MSKETKTCAGIRNRRQLYEALREETEVHCPGCPAATARIAEPEYRVPMWTDDSEEASTKRIAELERELEVACGAQWQVSIQKAKKDQAQLKEDASKFTTMRTLAGELATVAEWFIKDCKADRELPLFLEQHILDFEAALTKAKEAGVLEVGDGG